MNHSNRFKDKFKKIRSWLLLFRWKYFLIFFPVLYVYFGFWGIIYFTFIFSQLTKTDYSFTCCSIPNVTICCFSLLPWYWTDDLRVVLYEKRQWGRSSGWSREEAESGVGGELEMFFLFDYVCKPLRPVSGQERHKKPFSVGVIINQGA